MKKIYVGCSLRKASKAFVDKVAKFKAQLSKTSDIEVLEFIGLGDHDDTEVFLWDIKCVESCDIFIAICDEPSTGLGIEIERAAANNKQTLLLAQEGAVVSKMITGYAKLADTMQFIRYDKIDIDGLEKARKFIESV